MAEWNPDRPIPAWMQRLERSAESLASIWSGTVTRPTSGLAARGHTVSDLMKEIENSHPFDGISRRITDATSLMEAVYWHEKMIEQLGLEIMALHVSDDERSIYPISAMRVLQKIHGLTVERLKKLILRGRSVS